MLDILTRPTNQLFDWQFMPLRQRWFQSVEDFRPKVIIDINKGAYRIKTVTSATELKAALAIRKKVFHFEFSKKLFSFASEFDCYDTLGDHLAIVDNSSGQMVGVYRLLCSKFTDRFYSASEFHIDQLLDKSGVKIELSRACIEKEHRNGQVLNLLWKGIAAYAQKTQAETLFGLSSVQTMDLDTIGHINSYFEENNLTDHTDEITPTAEYRIDDFISHASNFFQKANSITKDEVYDMIPPLFQLYLKAGAKVCSHPVIDAKMKCTDWFITLNFADMSPSFARRFLNA